MKTIKRITAVLLIAVSTLAAAPPRRMVIQRDIPITIYIPIGVAAGCAVNPEWLQQPCDGSMTILAWLEVTVFHGVTTYTVVWR